MHAHYMDDAYCKELDTTVVAVKDGKYVVLEDTIFYPQGGGQPHDTGRLVKGDEAYKVVYAGKFDGKASHEVDRPGLRQGDRVRCTLDWPRRYAHMRAHTASHVLAAVLHDDWGAKISGNQLSEKGFRVDFDLEHFDRDLLQGAIDKTNALLAQGLPVSITYLPREEALKDSSMVKLAGALPPAIATLRVVTIGDPSRPVDRQADGGTHVCTTAEVGTLLLVKAENKGKSNRRVYVELKEA